MSNVEPYVPAQPGGLITAELWNEMQRRIYGDIGTRIEKAVADLKRVDRSGDAEKLGGKTAEELAKEIVARALGEIPKRTGYRRVFARLPVVNPNPAPPVEYVEIKHELKAYPLVDVYQLDAFPVICRADNESGLAWVNFYLYHSSEKRIGRPEAVVIQESRGPVFRLPFFATLAELGVEYQDDDSLADLVNEFWKKLFSAPNGEFDERQYCHSPWWQRCCSDDRTVADIRRAGDENDLWVKLQPRKTINYPSLPVGIVPPETNGVPVPPDLEVVHFDLDTLGIRMIHRGRSALPVNVADPRAGHTFPIEGGLVARDDLAVMVLLQAGAPAVGGAGPGGGQGPAGPAAY
jgi:hypothetical protein